jgi:hypothetical protein
MIEINESSPKITSYVGDLEVIGNGIAPSNIESKLKLVLDDLQFEFDFVSDKENKGYTIVRKVIEKKLSFILTNFENALGTGVITPLEIGHHSGKRLYISFWVWTPNASEGVRIISWSMLKGGNVILTEGENV